MVIFKPIFGYIDSVKLTSLDFFIIFYDRHQNQQFFLHQNLDSEEEDSDEDDDDEELSHWFLPQPIQVNPQISIEMFLPQPIQVNPQISIGRLLMM